MKNKLSGCLPIVYATLIFFLLVLFVALFGSCYTQKKATEQTQKALIKYPEVVANVARTAFPCVTTKSDTVVTSHDSIVFIECPEQPDNPALEYIRDTVTNTVTKYLKGETKFYKVPVTLPIRTITIIKKEKDSAETYLLNKEINRLKAYSEKADRKIHSRNTWLKWILLVLALSLFGNWLQLKSKLK